MGEDKGRRICIRGGHLWTGEADRPRRGGLLVADGRIAAVLDPAEEDAAAAGAEEDVDASGLLLTPPLADGHVHSPATLLRGTENSLPLELWSFHTIAHGLGFTERCVRAAARLTAAEMIRNGIGAYVDHLPQTRLAAAALDADVESGLRVGLAPFFADLQDEDILGIPIDPAVAARLRPKAPRAPAEVAETFEGLDGQVRAAGAGRITLLLGPNAPQRCSDAAWAVWARLRGTLGLGSHTHLLETAPQARHCRERWPAGVVAALDDAGLLDERLSVAHGIWLDDGERETLARRGVVVSHNPISNAMLGSGRMDVRAALDAGIELALGTDSANTGGRHDLFEAMRHMLVAGRSPGSDFERWIRPVEAFRAATRGAARAIDPVPGAGILRRGGPADILALDFRHGSLAAAPVSIDSVVAHADARSVRFLMVAGDWLLRDGVIRTFDEAAAEAEAAACAAELREAAQTLAGALEALRGPYAGWQDRIFAPLACGCCGHITPATPRPRTMR